MTIDAEILIASLPDREHVVAEIWIEEEEFAELTREQDHLAVRIFPRLSGKPWSLRLEDVLGLLARAQQRLLAHDEHCSLLGDTE